MKSTTVGAAVVLAALLVPVGGPADAGTEARGLGKYQCTVEGGLSPSDTDLALNVKGVPASLQPGDVLRLKGLLDMTFPSDVGTQSKLQLANEAGLVATNFSLAIAVGTRRFLVKPVAVAAKPQPIGSPFVVSASVEFDEFVVPPGASGELVIAMPSDARTANPAGNEPKSVVFKATISQDSPFAAERQVGCALIENDAPGVVARIPIEVKESGAGDGSTSMDSGDPGGSPSNPPAPWADPLPAAELPQGAEGPTGDAQPPPGPGDETSIAAAAAGEATGASLVKSSAAIPPATRRPGTFIPTWTLIVMMLTLFGLAVAYAARRRVVLASITQAPRSTSQLSKADETLTRRLA